MLDDLFLQEIFTSVLMLRDTGIHAIENMVQSIMEGKEIKTDESGARKIAGISIPDTSGSDNPYNEFSENSIAVIPIIGMMLKYGYWWRPGMDDLAEMIRLADGSPKIAGTVLLVNTPGGTTESVIQLEDAMRNRTKPSVGLIDGQCCSGGIYAASFCDELYAMNRMCEVGSIGTYAQLIDTREAEKKWGYKIEQIYPPESKYKNLSYREAIDGKPERIIREELTPYAVHFQNIIRENRKKLDQSIEGILEGRIFYAYDAVENGLIDGIMNMQQTVERVKSLANDKNIIYSQFKN
jgi:ClpP class serine protease